MPKSPQIDKIHSPKFHARVVYCSSRAWHHIILVGAGDVPNKILWTTWGWTPCLNVRLLLHEFPMWDQKRSSGAQPAPLWEKGAVLRKHSFGVHSGPLGCYEEVLAQPPTVHGLLPYRLRARMTVVELQLGLLDPKICWSYSSETTVAATSFTSRTWWGHEVPTKIL